MNRPMKKTVLLLIALLTLGTAQESMAAQNSRQENGSKESDNSKEGCCYSYARINPYGRTCRHRWEVCLSWHFPE